MEKEEKFAREPIIPGKYLEKNKNLDIMKSPPLKKPCLVKI